MDQEKGSQDIIEKMTGNIHDESKGNRDIEIQNLVKA